MIDLLRERGLGFPGDLCLKRRHSFSDSELADQAENQGRFRFALGIYSGMLSRIGLVHSKSNLIAKMRTIVTVKMALQRAGIAARCGTPRYSVRNILSSHMSRDRNHGIDQSESRNGGRDF